MKKLFIIGLLSLFIGCTSKDEYQKVSFNELPDDLKDCKFYSLTNAQGTFFTYRCPNSTTTLNTVEKYPQVSVIIDGEVYVKSEKKDETK